MVTPSSLRRGCGQSGLAGWRAVAVPVCWPRRRADMDANCERVSASEGRVSALMCRRRRRQVVFWVGEDGREELRGPRCRVGAFSIGCRAIAAIRLELLLCGRAQSRERSRARRGGTVARRAVHPPPSPPSFPLTMPPEYRIKQGLRSRGWCGSRAGEGERGGAGERGAVCPARRDSHAQRPRTPPMGHI